MLMWTAYDDSELKLLLKLFTVVMNIWAPCKGIITNSVSSWQHNFSSFFNTKHYEFLIS